MVPLYGFSLILTVWMSTAFVIAALKSSIPWFHIYKLGFDLCRLYFAAGMILSIVNFAHSYYHSDEESRTQQLGLVIMGASIPANLQWKTLDGSFVTMTQSLAGQIFGAVAAHDSATFAVAENHRAAMELTSNPEAYDYQTGWPTVYAN